MNREGWLTEVAKRAEAFFRGYRLLPYRVACGFPSKAALARNRRVGECHYPRSQGGFSEDRPHEIFISPLLGDSLEVAGTLCHEMAHVVAGYDAGHGRGFVRVCKRVGLTKGPPGSVMPGPEMDRALRRDVLATLGPYPHTALAVTAHAAKPKAVTLCRCEVCGCRITIGLKWLAAAGPPTCGCGGAMRPMG